MLSGQSLSIHGDGLSQFELVDFCKAVLIAPTKVRDQPIGVICVAREEVNPFSERDQAMLEAVADYASISLVNARLFQALETRAKRLQQAVSETHLEEEPGPLALTGLKESLDSINASLSQLIDDVYDPEVYAALDQIASQVKDLLEQIGSPRLSESKPSDQPKSVSPS
jgi:GAF domain-containing protein